MKNILITGTNSYIGTSLEKWLEKLITEVCGRKIKLTKIFNGILGLMSRKDGILNKVFENLVYEQGMSDYKENYRMRDSRESIIEAEFNRKELLSCNKKRICVICTISKTLDWFVVESMRNLSDNGYEVFLVCDMEEAFIERNKDYAHCVHIHMDRGINLLNAFKATSEMYKLFKNEKFDIIQYSTPNASLYASIAGKLAKVSVRLYCQWGLRYVGLTGIIRSFFKLIEKIICELSTWIEPDSVGNLTFCRNEGLYSENKSSVVWNGSASGVNLNKFNIAKKDIWRNEIRNRFEIQQDEFVFGFVGRVDRDKGFNELVESFKRIESKDIRLLIVGMEDKIETVDTKLYAYSKESDRIIYTGVVTDVEKYMAVMDCLVFPSYREGFGSVVIEAEAMGVPVIVTDIPGPTDAMLKDITGLVVKKADVKTLNNAMINIYRDSIKRDQMGSAGYKYVSENFEQKKLFEMILQDRNRLLGVFDNKCSK